MQLSYISLTSILLTLITTASAESEQQLNTPPNIKGVSPEDQHKYQPDSSGYFTCLTNSSIRIPISKVNDDYCDCPDGSDEAGTSACSNSRFYCANKGFRPGYLPGFKVNDGKCDYEVCCDGSDEAEGLCPDMCAVMAQEYQIEKQAKIKVLKNGLKLKNKILDRATDVKVRLVAEKEKFYENLNQLETELSELENLSTERNALMGDMFNGIEGKVNVLSQSINDQARAITDQLDKLKGLESALKALSNDYNPNFNDPAVKAAVSSYRDFEANNQVGSNRDGADLGFLSNQINDINNELESLKKKVGELASSSNVETAVPSEPSFFEEFVSQLLNSFLGVTPSKPKAATTFAGDDSQVQNRIKDLKKQVKSMKKDLNKREEDLKKSFGPDDILRGLQDTCILDSISGYDYKVCFTDKLEQVGKDGRSTKIGSFDNCEVSNDGFLNIQFGKGEKCWNGPIRKGDVTILCGSENRILSVSEPEKCEYHFVVTSPIGCFQEDLDQLENDDI